MTRSILISAVVLAATVFAAPAADAQPGAGYYAEPPPPAPVPYAAPPPPVRHGLTLGFDLGIGSMDAESGPLRCDGCESDPAAGTVGFWVGAMINPRFALMFHGSITGQALDEFGDETLINSTALLAAKLWLSPRLWLKAGLGFASLTISDPVGDEQLDEGGAGMLGIGFEAVHSRNFSLDVSLTATSSSYEAIDDTITSGTLNLGFNWY
jgi:hypothetical protein